MGPVRHGSPTTGSASTSADAERSAAKETVLDGLLRLEKDLHHSSAQLHDPFAIRDLPHVVSSHVVPPCGSQHVQLAVSDCVRRNLKAFLCLRGAANSAGFRCRSRRPASGRGASEYSVYVEVFYTVLRYNRVYDNILNYYRLLILFLM